MENNKEKFSDDLNSVPIPPEDMKNLAIDEKNLEWDETYRTFHNILYGREYKKDNEKSGKITKKVNITDFENYLVHKVTGKETIQGLALKYGVQASDIKKVNRLWTNEEVFARKEIIIPTNTEQFLKYQSELNPTLRSDKVQSQDYSYLDRKGEINKFIEITACEPEVAYYYLVEKNWNFTRALGFYFSQLEGGSDGSDMETKRKSLDEKQRKALKEEMEEIWEEPASIKNGKNKLDPPLEELRNNLPATYLIGGDKNFSVNKIQKRLQERLTKQEDEIFEI